MKEDTSCRHPDCVYRTGPHDNTGNCNYSTITGHCRIVGLPPRLQLPCNCPYYMTSGIPLPEPKPLTTRDKALAMYETGATDREVEAALGWHKGRMCALRRQLGLPVNKDVRETVYDWDKARAAYDSGANDQRIARLLGCCVSSVWRWREKNELPPNKEYIRKENVNEDQSTGRAVREGQEPGAL